MHDEAPPVSLAGSPLGDARHVCALFGSDDEEYRVMLPFMKDGLECGDRAIHVVDGADCRDHRHRLTSAGIDAATAEADGQLELRTTMDTYLHNDHFDAERLLAVFEQMASGNAGGAFPRSRIVCRMGWASANRVRVDDVIEFESRVNEVWRRHDDVVICTYPLAQFGGDAVIDIVRTHPMVIIGGVLHRNPFFVPPEQFVPEFRARMAERRRRAQHTLLPPPA